MAKKQRNTPERKRMLAMRKLEQWHRGRVALLEYHPPKGNVPGGVRRKLSKNA